MRRPLLSLFLFTAACGGSAVPAAVPSAPASPSAPPPAYATPEDALADLDRSERDLHAAVGSPAARSSAPSSLGGATAAPAPAAPPAAPMQPRAETKEDESRDTGCPVACRALASMRRAADAVCRLTSDADPRCTQARARVESSASSVATCGCS